MNYPRSCAPADRALHLLDVENLLAGQLWPGDTAGLWAVYTAPVVPADHVVSAFGPTGAARAAFELPTQVATRIGRQGRDAVDLVLLSLLEDAAWIASRYPRVVIASADHIFSGPATALAEAGVHVTQVLGKASRSYHLSLACHTTTVLPLSTTTALAAA